MAGVSETRTIDALLTTTLANYRNILHDNIFDVYPFLSWLNGKLGEALRGSKRKRTIPGGESIIEQLLYEANSTVKPYSKYESLDTTPQDGMTWARYEWRQYAGAVSISGFELRANQGETEKLIDLLKAKTRQMEMSFRNVLSQDAWSAGGAKKLDGLGLILDDAATLAGLSPTTYTWWKPKETASGSFAAQGLKDMRKMYNDLSYGDDVPDAIFMTQAIFEFFETTLQPQERYVNQKAANTGFQTLTFKAIPVFFDRDATSGTISFLNSEYINWCVHKDADISPGPFITPENQDAKTSQSLFMGNITVSNRRMHGQLTGVTA